MKEIQIENWDEFKNICITKKKLNIQYIKSSINKDYHIFAVEDRLYWFVNLMGDKDIKDFEKNYLRGANKRII